MNPRRAKDILVFGAAMVVLAADQLSKSWVQQNLLPGMPWNPIPWLRPILSFTLVTNKGASFGLFPELSGFYTLVAMVVIAAILFFYRRFPTDQWLVALSLGLQLGGAFGNLVDRIWRGQVVDFIDLNFWPLQEWPVFNVADSSIVVGVCMLAIYLLFFAQDWD